MPTKRTRLRSVAGVLDGRPLRPFEYPLEGTPCAQVVGTEFRFVECGMAHEFKSGTIFAAKGMDSYAAYPLCDGNGFQLGLLVAMDRRPLPDAALAEAVLKIIGSRIAVELERASADAVLRTAALAVSNARGASVFTELVRYLATILRVDMAFVAKPIAGTAADAAGHRDAARRPAGRRVALRHAGHAMRGRAERRLQGLQRRRRPSCSRPMRRCSRTELVAYAGHPLHDLDGKPVGILAIASRQPLWHPERIESMMQIFAVRAGAEIDRLRSEEALRGSEESYRTIFEASEDGVVIHDWHTGTLVDLNPKACEMSGYRREEVLGAPMTAFCPADRRSPKPMRAAISRSRSRAAARRSNGSAATATAACTGTRCA